MNQEIGDQYSRDKVIDKTGFLEKARLHQSKYRAFRLNVPFDKFGNYLIKEDALKGLNFYNDFNIFEQVKERYPNYSRPLYANMLRSEHISFNLFSPLKSDLEYCRSVFNYFMNGQIKSIDDIKIEYAPSPAEKYLKDKTSFDTYIEYTHSDNSKAIIGIEVKYTEREYKLKPGSKQETDINNRKSKYYVISEKCKLYKDNTINHLISDKFRQVWRNQLLGESIIIEDNHKFKHFTSITIFPKSNLHFIETSQQYLDMLENNDNRFIPIIFEDFITCCKNYKPNDRFGKWIDYINNRYIISDL